MSALQPPEPDVTLVDSFLHYAPIGAAAAIIRALLSEKPTSVGFILRRTIAASITAWLVAPACHSLCPTDGSAIAAVGAISYAAPEVWDCVGKKIVALVRNVWK